MSAQTQAVYPGIHLMAQASAVTYTAMVSSLQLWATYQILMQQLMQTQLNAMSMTGQSQSMATLNSGINDALSQKMQGIQSGVSGGSGFATLGAGVMMYKMAQNNAEGTLIKSQNNSILLSAVKYLQKNPQGQPIAGTQPALPPPTTAVTEVLDSLKVMDSDTLNSIPKGLEGSKYIDDKGNYVIDPQTKNLLILKDIQNKTTMDELLDSTKPEGTAFQALARMSPEELTALSKQLNKVQTNNEKTYSEQLSRANNVDGKWQQAQQALSSMTQGITSTMTSNYMMKKASYDSLNALMNTTMQLTTTQSKTTQDNISLGQQQQSQTMQMMSGISSSQTPS